MLASIRNLIVPMTAGALGWSFAVAAAWTIAVVVNEFWLDYERIVRWRDDAGLPALAGRSARETMSTSAALATSIWGASCLLAYAGARVVRSMLV